MNLLKDTTETLPPGSLHPDCWTADQQLEILCETLRNITSGTTKLHEANYDHAALYLEIAAEKLRLLERCRQSNAGTQRRRDENAPLATEAQSRRSLERVVRPRRCSKHQAADRECKLCACCDQWWACVLLVRLDEHCGSEGSTGSMWSRFMFCPWCGYEWSNDQAERQEERRQ